MDRDTRNRIQRATQDARRLLEREYAEQLEGLFDVHLDGTVAPAAGAHLDAAQQVLRGKLVAAAVHRRSAGAEPAEAVSDYLREAAFTTLNRFVALKMLEARGLVQECISNLEQSSGFREFTGLAPGLAETSDHGYRLYVESLFDEVGREVGVLFDRRDPASLLWPRRQALADLLAVLNATDLASVWAEDETIGWVYQYFNGDDERKQMRAESQAPRNSRELAVRNQFFTPRYVVEFLADNTLGRIWYEMRRGRTVLLDLCTYLVHRREEVFLAEFAPSAAVAWLAGASDEEPDVTALGHAVDGYARRGDPDAAWTWAQESLERVRSEGAGGHTSQELLDTLFLLCRGERFCDGLLRSHEQEVTAIRSELNRRRRPEAEPFTLVPWREPKDPRDLKILDPACGSGHFLLYAFDLLYDIYEEAWQGGGGRASTGTGRNLREDYPTLEDLRRAVPGLVVGHNLHGIDIDPRAAQIAALALWLRAQRAYNDLGIGRGDRPAISRTNVVVAEPMPAEADLRREILSSLDRRLAALVEEVFRALEPAGEMGSLLDVEERVQAAVRATYGEDGGLFRELDEERWAEAERALLATLARYGEQAQSAGAYRRRLFAEDAARGLGLVDLCRKRFDVVLMNPPFGAASSGAKDHLARAYPRSKNDLLAAFVERGVRWLRPGAMLGAITSRTAFFLTSFQKWREEVVLAEARPVVLADLGHGVMDAAMVEAAAYVLERR